MEGQGGEESRGDGGKGLGGVGNVESSMSSIGIRSRSTRGDHFPFYEECPVDGTRVAKMTVGAPCH